MISTQRTVLTHAWEVIALLGLLAVSTASTLSIARASSEDTVIAANASQTGSVAVESWRDRESGCRVARVSACVDAAREQVWRAITDFNHYRDFMWRCRESVIVDTSGGHSEASSSLLHASRGFAVCAVKSERASDTLLFYHELDLGAPIGRVRSLVEVVTDPISGTVVWKQIEGDAARYEGSWQITPSGSGTRIEYTVQFRFGVYVPPFLIHFAVRRGLPKVIRALDERIAALE